MLSSRPHVHFSIEDFVEEERKGMVATYRFTASALLAVRIIGGIAGKALNFEGLVFGVRGVML